MTRRSPAAIFKKTSLVVLGVLCILAGIVALIVPGISGIALIFIGLSMFAPVYARRLKRRMLRRFFKKDFVYLEEWRGFKVEAGFTTRHFPVMLRKTSDLNDPAKLQEFTEALSKSSVFKSHKLHAVRKAVLLEQVHGSDIAVLDDASAHTCEGIHLAGRYDAAVTCISGLTLLVFTADCLPVFFVAGDWVGLAHAGWRGTKEKIAAKTLQVISEKSGISPHKVRIIFGPCIGVDAYEVGSELNAYFPASSFKTALSNGKQVLKFDLQKENRSQLAEAGADPEKIFDDGACTFTERDNFYSYRREGERSGRMVSLITKL